MEPRFVSSVIGEVWHIPRRTKAVTLPTVACIHISVSCRGIKYRTLMSQSACVGFIKKADSAGNCANCRYPGCKYNGLKPEDLPHWMKKRGIEK